MAFRVAAAGAAARGDQLDQAAMFLGAAEATAGLWRGRGPWLAALEEARGEIAWAGGIAPRRARGCTRRARRSPARAAGSTPVASHARLAGARLTQEGLGKAGGIPSLETTT